MDRDNLGRRFYACPDYDPQTNQRGCKFCRWFDVEDPVEWQRAIIVSLMEENKKLRNEVLQLRKSLEESNQSCRKMESQLVMMKMKKNEGTQYGLSGKGFVMFFWEQTLLLIRHECVTNSFIAP